ncbi:MAG: flagellar basal body rod protein FlgB [Acidimicrobiales bacterium]
MSDLSIGILKYALDGLTLQQQAASSNISNVQTPGYTSEEVDFESSLAKALAQGSGNPTATTLVSPSAAPRNTDGNNVDLSQEMATMQTSTLQYQTLVDALNARFGVMAASESSSF